MSNFHPLEVVSRGSETQLQVGAKFELFNSAFQGLTLGALIPSRASLSIADNAFQALEQWIAAAIQSFRDWKDVDQRALNHFRISAARRDFN